MAEPPVPSLITLVPLTLSKLKCNSGGPATRRVPLLTTVAPVYVFAADSVSVPAPCLVSPPLVLAVRFTVVAAGAVALPRPVKVTGQRIAGAIATARTGHQQLVIVPAAKLICAMAVALLPEPPEIVTIGGATYPEPLSERLMPPTPYPFGANSG